MEGKPDPFPSLVESGPSAPSPRLPRNPASAPLDTGSEVAFPSLAPTVAPAIKQTTSAWGASNGPRIAPAVVGSNFVTDNFTIASIDLSSAGKDGKPITLGEIMKQVMLKHKVKIEASSNQTKKQTTFNLKSESTKELEKAKRSLIAQLSPTVRSLSAVYFRCVHSISVGYTNGQCSRFHYCYYCWTQGSVSTA